MMSDQRPVLFNDQTVATYAMHTGFLFSATHFDEWNVDVSVPGTGHPVRPITAEFDDWYRLQREMGSGLSLDVLIKPLNALWLGSFRFIESGVLEEEDAELIAHLPLLLDELEAAVYKNSHEQSFRFERIRLHLNAFGEKAGRLYNTNLDDITSQALPLEGSAWDITWENLVVNPEGGRLSMHYKSQDTLPFRLHVTGKGFVNASGRKGNWHWQSLPGGRIALHVGEDYPVGWAWYNQADQSEITMHFYKTAFVQAFERMRWVRYS